MKYDAGFVASLFTGSRVHAIGEMLRTEFAGLLSHNRPGLLNCHPIRAIGGLS